MPKGDLYPSHDLAKLILKIGLVYNYRSVIYWFNYRHYWDGYGIITDGHIIWFPSYGSSKFPYNFFTHTFIINLNLYVLQHLLIDCFFSIFCWVQYLRVCLLKWFHLWKLFSSHLSHVFIIFCPLGFTLCWLKYMNNKCIVIRNRQSALKGKSLPTGAWNITVIMYEEELGDIFNNTSCFFNKSLP